MKSPLTLRCYVRETEMLYDFEVLQALFTALTEQGYYLVAEEEFEPSFRVWWSTMSARPPHLDTLPAERQRLLLHLRQSGLSGQLRCELALYHTLREPHLVCRAYHGEHLFSFDIDFMPGGPTGTPLVLLSIEPEYLTAAHGEERARMHALWIAALKALYQYLHPVYGWVHDMDFDRPGFAWAMDIDPEHVEERTALDAVLRNDAAAGHLRFLSLANMLGPELVAHYSRERILTTPAWYLEPLEDGGVLLLPEPFSWDYVPVWNEVEQHLAIAPSESITVAHLAATLHSHGLLKHISVSQLEQATAKSCLFDILAVLLPQRYVTLKRHYQYREEDYTRLLLQLGRVTSGEWEPDLVSTFFLAEEALVEFECAGESFYWRFPLPQWRAGVAPGFLEHLRQFAHSRLAGTFLPLRGKGHGLTYFYLSARAWRELEYMLPRLRSGWPSLSVLRSLFPRLSSAHWRQLREHVEAHTQAEEAEACETSAPGESHERADRPCRECATRHLERCRLVSEPLWNV